MSKVKQVITAPTDSAIWAQNVSFSYQPKAKIKEFAIQNISLDIKYGEFVAIVGHTGSGKSTFLQHLNALVKLQSGNLFVCGQDLSAKKTDLKTLRKTVGMVFQYPEYQLFADTVYDDVCFGLKNFGVDKAEWQSLAKQAIELVGLNFDEVKNKSPFDLSGGEKRRVALAGVLVTKPKVLVLDEPTAGLDPQGKREILSLVSNLNKTQGVTVIMVSHDMDEVYENAQRIVVFKDSNVFYDLPPRELFRKEKEIADMDLEVPQMAQFCNELERNGIVLPTDAKTVQDVFDALTKLLGGQVNAN